MNLKNEIINKIGSSDIGKRILKGAFWSFTGTALAKLIVLLGGILCARILGKVEYGEFGMIRSTISMFVALGTVGLGLTATKYISEYRECNKSRISSIFILTSVFSVITGILVTFIILLLAPYLAEKSLHAPYLINEIRFGAILLFFTVIDAVQTGILAGFEDFRSIAINTFISNVGEVILMLIAAYFYNVIGAIIGFGLGYVILFFLNINSIKKNIQRDRLQIEMKSISMQDLGILYRFSIPATLSSLMVAPAFWFVRSLLVRQGGFSEMGLYEVADQGKIIILFIPSAISQIVLPILSNIVGKKDSDSFWNVLKYNIYLNVVVSFVLVMFVVLASNYILEFYGTEFSDNRPIIILAFSTIFTSISCVVGLAISSKAKMWIGFFFNAFWACMLIMFSYIFLHNDLGAVGLSLAVLCSYMIHALLQFMYLYFIVRIK